MSSLLRGLFEEQQAEYLKQAAADYQVFKPAAAEDAVKPILKAEMTLLNPISVRSWSFG